MRALIPSLLALALLATPGAADPWKDDTISAGEVDLHTIWNPGCDLLWFWTLTFELEDPAVGDTVSVTVQTTDSPLASAGLATWTGPTVTVRGSGALCALVVEVAGLTVVGDWAYRLDFELASLPDQ